MDNSSKKKASKTRHLSRTVYCYSLAFLFVVSANTLPGRIGSRSIRFIAAIVLLELIYCFYYWATNPIPKNSLRKWFTWMSLLVISFVFTFLTSGATGGLRIILFFLELMVAPLFCYCSMQSGQWKSLCRAIVIEVLIVALVSLFLWVVGSNLGIIQTNCSIESTWNGRGTIDILYGYYGLQYNVQRIQFGTYNLVRNTSFFTEGPMFNYLLCCAVLLDYYYQVFDKSYMTLLSITILLVTQITTVSTTSIVFIMLFGISVYQDSYQRKRKTNSLSLILLILMVIVVSILLVRIMGEKMETSSGSTRLDDYVAGFKAWMDSPVYGHGFGNGDVIKEYMSGFRATNLGFSNSPMAILARGGLLLLLPYIVSFLNYFRSTISKYHFLGFLTIVLWAITIVWDMPMLILFIGIGYSFSLLETE